MGDRVRLVRPVRAVVFDIGETLIDRTREWAGFAAWLGMPAHTFSAVFGAVVASGGGVADVIDHFRPGATWAGLRPQVAAAGLLPPLDEADLYPGARTALQQLQRRGYVVGIAGNQPVGFGDELRALGLAADFAAVSAELGASKPQPEFFGELVRRCGVPADAVLYVGDQLDHDVVAAGAAGLQVARVRTGPWGQLVRDPLLEAPCVAVVDSVADLPAVLADPLP